MKWLGRWLFKIASDAGQEEREHRLFGASKSSMVSIRDDVDGDDGLNITVRRAIGGRIVTFRHYDHKTDRNSHRLYIIPDELDFERELGKMITLESMRS
jgi:hypothetical protein